MTSCFEFTGSTFYNSLSYRLTDGELGRPHKRQHIIHSCSTKGLFWYPNVIWYLSLNDTSHRNGQFNSSLYEDLGTRLVSFQFRSKQN